MSASNNSQVIRYSPYRWVRNPGALRLLLLAVGSVLFVACVDSGDDDFHDAADVQGTDGDCTSDSSDADTTACQLPIEAEALEPTSEPVRFSINRDTALDSHIFVPIEFARSDTGYGGGGALIDFNDDGLIDVFLGRREPTGTPPCLYLNESADGSTAFRRFQCFPSLDRVGGGRTADWDGDGSVELLVYGDSRAVIFDF
jgi:hypothetical protein